MNDLVTRLEGELIEYLDPGEEFRTSYDQLRPAERYFVDAYTTTLDPKLAARSWNRGGHAGAPDTVLATDFMRRPLVRAAIAEIMAERRRRYAPEIERLKRELAAIAFSSHSDYMRLGKDGEPYYDLTDVSQEAMSAISEITVEDYSEGRGPGARDIRKVKLKTHDKIAAMRLLAQLNGAVAPDGNTVNIQVNQGGPGGPIRTITGGVTPDMTIQQAAHAYELSLKQDDDQ